MSTLIKHFKICLSTRLFITSPINKRVFFYFSCSSVAATLSLAKCSKRNFVLAKQKADDTDLVLFNKSGSDRETPLCIFIQLIRSEVFKIISAMLLAGTAAFANIQISVLLGQLVDLITRLGRVTFQDFLQTMYEPALKIACIYVLQAVATFGCISLLFISGDNMAEKLRKRLFSTLIRLDISMFDQLRTGHLLHRLTTDVSDFRTSFKSCITQGLRAITQIVGSVVQLTLISPHLTGCLCSVVVTLVVSGTAMGRALRELQRHSLSQFELSTSVAEECLSNIRTVRAFGMEEHESELYADRLRAASAAKTMLGQGIAAFQSLSNLALNGLVLGLIFGGGAKMVDGTMSSGDLMSFVVSSQIIQRSMAQLSLLFGVAVKGQAGLQRIVHYLNAEPRIPLHGGETIPDSELRGEVRFDAVDFAYPGRREKPVLRSFTLTVPAGKTVALCGHSGGGKSTLAALLERFYEPDAGTVYLDGRDVTCLDPTWLRRRALAYISQDPVLFCGTVRENIRFGRPEASDAEVEAAARAADAHAFIDAFPSGYETVVGERGASVSGGQRQRIALARALLRRDAPVLVLDEATSALDAEAEATVRAAIERAGAERTLLIIAHRLSTIRSADLIAVVDCGRVAEVGTHDELKARNGLYANLIRLQESHGGES